MPTPGSSSGPAPPPRPWCGTFREACVLGVRGHQPNQPPRPSTHLAHRGHDGIGRRGGEEFVVILDQPQLREAQLVGDPAAQRDQCPRPSRTTVEPGLLRLPGSVETSRTVTTRRGRCCGASHRRWPSTKRSRRAMPAIAPSLPCGARSSDPGSVRHGSRGRAAGDRRR